MFGAHTRVRARETATIVFAASLVMAATLPGRTHGIGLITTRLLDDYSQVSESGFASINLVATLIGSLMCLPCGWLIDRFGIRSLATLVLAALGCVVLWMASAPSLSVLCIAIALTRGIGQSMLSVVSLSIMGKSFPNRSGAVMGSYALVLTFMMAACTGLLANRVANFGWRQAWSEAGWGILLVAPFVWISLPRSISLVGTISVPMIEDATCRHTTLGQALTTPCFWAFSLSISLFGMISSGVSLFQQSILASKGFSEQLYHVSLVVGLFVGMIANLIGGWLSTKFPMQHLLGLAMWLLAGSLVTLPFLTTSLQAYGFCIAYSLAGGMITVLFFTVWGQAFGTRELAKIQGSAQMLTVLGSSCGPLLVTESNARFQSYDPAVCCFALASILVGCFSFLVSVPNAKKTTLVDI